MEMDIIAELTIMKQLNVKPNFSDLSRKYGIDRHTIKKYWEEGGKIIKQRKKRGSKYDAFKDDVIITLSKPGVNIKAAYEFLKDKYPPFNWNYSGFRDYVSDNQLKSNIKMSLT